MASLLRGVVWGVALVAQHLVLLRHLLGLALAVAGQDVEHVWSAVAVLAAAEAVLALGLDDLADEQRIGLPGEGSLDAIYHLVTPVGGIPGTSAPCGGWWPRWHGRSPSPGPG